MLIKGIVTFLNKDGLFGVWSKETNGEVFLDKRLLSNTEQKPSVGSWIAFTLKNNSSFIGEFTSIPDILPTKVDEKSGIVMIKTKITFPRNSIYRCDLLAYSKELGAIGIFKNIPNLKDNCDYVVWVERIPQSLSNLERIYKASWHIPESLPEPVRKIMVRRFLPERQSTCSGNALAASMIKADCEDSCSEAGTQISLISRNSNDNTNLFSEKQRELSQAYPAVQRSFNPQPFIPVEQQQKKLEIVKNDTTVGLITSTYNRIAFVWSPFIGEGIVVISFGKIIRHGEWIKFRPVNVDQKLLQTKNDESKRSIYVVQEFQIIDPLYPTHSFKTTVSVEVKLFVPYNYRDSQSNLWVEFFGTVYDSMDRIAQLDLNRLMGRSVLVRIMKIKNEENGGSKWIVHKVLRVLKEEDSLPLVTSSTFAADALRYMNEIPEIRKAMIKTDADLANKIIQPHLLSDSVLRDFAR